MLSLSVKIFRIRKWIAKRISKSTTFSLPPNMHPPIFSKSTLCPSTSSTQLLTRSLIKLASPCPRSSTLCSRTHTICRLPLLLMFVSMTTQTLFSQAKQTTTKLPIKIPAHSLILMSLKTKKRNLNKRCPCLN